jgi:hypothetical protein
MLRATDPEDEMANTAPVRSGETIEAVEIPVDSVTLNADLRVPAIAHGLVIFCAWQRQQPFQYTEPAGCPVHWDAGLRDLIARFAHPTRRADRC